jgi:hypothetical protein
VPTRALVLGLAVTEYEIIPSPAPLFVEVIVIQSTVLVAIQGQFVVLALMLKVPLLLLMAGNVT